MSYGPSQGGLGLIVSLRRDSPERYISRDLGDGDSALGSARFIRHY